VDATVAAFGKESGRPMLERHFAEVVWEQYEDELHCTDVDDLMAYLTSTPPGEGATDEQRADLRCRLEEAMSSGGGVLRVAKDSGCFTCRRPRSLG
jgi:hypothetical protein